MHYQFAHQVLRQAILAADRSELIALILNREVAAFCSELVETCFGTDDDFMPKLEGIIFDAEMGIFEVLHEDVQMVLISLPAPQNMTEAHYVLIALTNIPRYFTLEATTDSLDRLDSSFGILCEWTADGTHYNYGSCQLHPTKFIRSSMLKIRHLGPRELVGLSF